MLKFVRPKLHSSVHTLLKIKYRTKILHLKNYKQRNLKYNQQILLKSWNKCNWNVFNNYRTDRDVLAVLWWMSYAFYTNSQHYTNCTKLYNRSSLNSPRVNLCRGKCQLLFHIAIYHDCCRAISTFQIAVNFTAKRTDTNAELSKNECPWFKSRPLPKNSRMLLVFPFP